MVALLHPIGPGSQIVIDRAVVLVGRATDCDAIIDFSSKISRMHCVLVQVDANYFIRDLGSMNGVRVNGERIAKEAMLIQGAEVSIGDVVYLFHANVQTAPRVAVRTRGGMPLSADESIPILDAEIIDEEILDAEILDDVSFAEDVKLSDEVEFVGDVEFLDEILDVELIPEVDVIDDIVEVIDDLEVIDDIEVIDVIENVEVIDDIEVIDVIEDMDVIEDFEVIDVIEDVDVIEEVQVIDDAEVVSDAARRASRQRRLR